MQQYRCLGSTNEEYNEVRGDDDASWLSRLTARCPYCGKRAGLYPWGSTVAREYGTPVGWRLKTHYAGRRRLTGGST